MRSQITPSKQLFTHMFFHLEVQEPEGA